MRTQADLELDIVSIALLQSGGTDAFRLPDPWVFDGARRVYHGGRPSAQWLARAVIPNPGRKEVELAIGNGDSPLSSVRDLITKLEVRT